MKHSITILNGKKHMKHTKHMSRSERRGLLRMNPDGSLGEQAGSAALATVIAAPVAIILDRVVSGMKKADGNLRYTANQSAALVAGIGLVGGVALHINGFSPKTGVALVAACGAVAGSRAYQARKFARELEANATPVAAPSTSTTPATATTPGTATTTQQSATPTSDFVLQLTPLTATVTPGANAVTQVYTLAVAPRDPARPVAAPVRVAVTGLSLGVTAQLSAQTLTAGAVGSLTLTVPANAAAGTVAFQVTGTGTGSTPATASVNGTLVIGAVASGPSTTEERTGNSGLPAGFTRRAGAAYPMQYGQVSRDGAMIDPSGAALAREQFQGYQLVRPRSQRQMAKVVPATATAAEIQGTASGQSKVSVLTAFPDKANPTEVDTGANSVSMLAAFPGKADSTEVTTSQDLLSRDDAKIDAATLAALNDQQAALEADLKMGERSAGAGDIAQSDEASAVNNAKLRKQMWSIDQIRRARREEAKSRECLCVNAPGGARVMARR